MSLARQITLSEGFRYSTPKPHKNDRSGQKYIVLELNDCPHMLFDYDVQAQDKITVQNPESCQS